jgi:methyl-accepting chemotaxis protein
LNTQNERHEMKIEWTIGKKLGTGFGLTLVLLLIIGGVSYFSISSLIENAKLVAHTHQVLENLEAVLSLLKDAETGQRGFLLTRQERYLKPYEEALLKLDQRIKDLRELTADNPNHKPRLDELERLKKLKLAELDKTIKARKADPLPEREDAVDLTKIAGLKTALDTVITDEGKKYMDEIRKVVTDMEDEENRLLKQRAAEEESSVLRTKTTIVAAAAVAVLVVSLFGFLLTRGITGPLSQVMEMSRKIAAGKLKQEKLAVGSSDEIGQLAAVFNDMVDNLRDLASRTTAVTESMNAASAQIMAATQQQAASTKEQAATVQEITTTMEEISQSGGQIAGKAKLVATSAEAASSASAAGLQAVQDTTRTMASIREQVEEVAGNIVALSEKTQAVGEIIATVNDIAERSNLLALNAAIEAASAGEQGNRFSVVANEMKNLADQAKTSTVQVRTILGDIQKGINSSVMFTEEAVKRVDSGKQQADVTEQTIRQMARTTLDSIQAFEQIIGAGNQQQIGFEQVAQGMKDIRQTAEQNASATAQLEKAVVNLNALSQELKKSVGRYQL